MNSTVKQEDITSDMVTDYLSKKALGSMSLKVEVDADRVRRAGSL